MFLISDWQSLGLAVAALLLAALGVALWRMQVRLRQLTSALDHMPQALCMFDQEQRVVLSNRQYLELHKLTPEAAKPGRTLRELLQYRKDSGQFSGDVDRYCQEVTDGVATGKTSRWRV